MSVFDRYFNGMHQSNHRFDNVRYLRVPKSFFEDAFSGGPFEFLTEVLGTDRFRTSGNADCEALSVGFDASGALVLKASDA